MDFSFLPEFLPYFNYGALVTLMVSVCVVFFGTILGVLLAFAQRSRFYPLARLKSIPLLAKWNPLAVLANTYIWIFRGTPMVVQIMISFILIKISAPIVPFGSISMDLSRLVPGIIIISMNSGAYVSETVRAGLNAVPPGQMEAAYSLGMRPWPTMRYVIMPQAIKNILPSLGNEFITIIKDSSLLSTIGVMELWNGATTVSVTTYLPLSPLLFAALYYLFMTSLMTWVIKALENHFNKGAKKE
ncbi:amino acid ABC transporter permease [Streptococcus ovuberis]|uniref:Amino acid ABC transporter permease n=1 Tax=Streptococcus ovuberis TaxID=1936207 RepID=A0A7X6N190_9STRE|nr:amino acid ABC transporter permease [Streptococcus ovuberis]NKZ20332.1 amino acid ABC transporter permease [Streptococcus ovuberis]